MIISFALFGYAWYGAIWYDLSNYSKPGSPKVEISLLHVFKTFNGTRSNYTFPEFMDNQCTDGIIFRMNGNVDCEFLWFF